MPLDVAQALSSHENAIRFSAARAGVLANNIANADTPHYKARDIDFASVLQDTLQNNNSATLALATTNDQHHVGIALSPEEKLFYRPVEQSSVDGNTVDVQKEKMEFAKNALQYQASLSFLDGKLKQIISALRAD